MNRRTFIRITGGTATFIAGAGAMAACTSRAGNSDDKLKTQALSAFERYKKVWDFDNFWKRGNTFI